MEKIIFIGILIIVAYVFIHYMVIKVLLPAIKRKKDEKIAKAQKEREAAEELRKKLSQKKAIVIVRNRNDQKTNFESQLINGFLSKGLVILNCSDKKITGLLKGEKQENEANIIIIGKVVNQKSLWDVDIKCLDQEAKNIICANTFKSIIYNHYGPDYETDQHLAGRIVDFIIPYLLQNK